MTIDAAWWGSILADNSSGISELGGSNRSADETYVFLPGRGDPRVVVDAASDAAMRDAVGRMASRALPGVVRRLVPIGSKVASRVGSTWSINAREGEPTLRQHLSDLLGRDVRLSVVVGPPRPNRKPVVRCFDGEAMVAVAKLGPESHTGAMVRNEARWLAEFDDRPLESSITPDLLHHGRFGDCELLVMSSLPLADEIPVTIGEMPNEVLAELIDRTGTTLGIGRSGFWRALYSRVGELVDLAICDAVAAIVDDPAAGRLPISFWHGDWSPWNVGRGSDGRWCVWDWERSNTMAPIGFDVLHLHHQYGSGLASGVDVLLDSGRSPDEVSLLRSLYLLELVARHDEAGATSTDRHRSVIDLLAS